MNLKPKNMKTLTDLIQYISNDTCPCSIDETTPIAITINCMVVELEVILQSI